MISKLQRLRHAIGKILVDSGIWLDGQVITSRQQDIWNEVGIVVAQAINGCVCVIHDIQGDEVDDAELENDLLIAVTILGPVNITPGQEPEEILWERTVRVLHNAVPSYDGGIQHYNYRLRYQGYRNADDMVPEDAQAAVQVARQSTFRIRFNLESDQ